MTKHQDLTQPNEQAIAEFALTDQDRALADWVHISLDRPVAELQESVIVKANRTARLRVEIGLEMLAIRNQCEYGEWTQWLQASGIDRERAAEAIRYAKFMSRLDPEERRKAMSLPVKKVYALATAEEAVLEEILSDDEKFDATTALSVSQMRSRIRELEGELGAEREVRKNTQKELRSVLNKAEPDKRWPAEVSRIRGEAHYFSASIAHAADNLEKLLVELRNDLPRHVSDGQTGAVEYGAAARTVYQAIAGPIGLFNILLHRFVEQYELGDYASNDPGDVPLLSQAEAQTLYDNWRLICQGEIADQKIRESDRREKAHRGRPGPKPGSRNKKR